MARALATLVVSLLLLAGCGDDDDADPAPARDSGSTSVRVTVDPDGSGPEDARARTVSCEDGTTGGDCDFLADVPLDAFDPVPSGKACTQIFGGPQTARITGTVRGERLDASFARSNGCEIARWDGVAALLGRG